MLEYSYQVTIIFLLLEAQGRLLHGRLNLRIPLQWRPPVCRAMPYRMPRRPHLLVHVDFDLPLVLHLIFPHLHAVEENCIRSAFTSISMYFIPIIAEYHVDCEFAYCSYLRVGIHKLHPLMVYLMIHERYHCTHGVFLSHNCHFSLHKHLSKPFQPFRNNFDKFCILYSYCQSGPYIHHNLLWYHPNLTYHKYLKHGNW